MLRQTSRTFFIPIMRLPRPLRDAVGSAYLCFRAIDEIEDHPDLSAERKARLLARTAAALRSSADVSELQNRLSSLFSDDEKILPQVTRELGGYAAMAPPGAAPIIWQRTADMAERMGDWCQRNWVIRNEADLDAYTYDVAGAVGELLTELWAWHDGTQADMREAVGFGRCLQAVNIARNQSEDRSRGVNFFPDGWQQADMLAYIKRQFALADAYISKLPRGPAREFCVIPLGLAKATVRVLEAGREKLSREEVIAVVDACSTAG